MSDTVRVKNRIKGLYRSRGVNVGGTEVYAPATREEWLRELPVRARLRAELRHRAEREMLGEARKHAIYRGIHL